jgi:hypothetical protein
MSVCFFKYDSYIAGRFFTIDRVATDAYRSSSRLGQVSAVSRSNTRFEWQQWGRESAFATTRRWTSVFRTPKRAIVIPLRAAAHLTASMRVIRAYLHVRSVSIADARSEVLHAAGRIEAGTAGEEIEALRTRLEKATGLSIAELAKQGKSWADASGASQIALAGRQS